MVLRCFFAVIVLLACANAQSGEPPADGTACPNCVVWRGLLERCIACAEGGDCQQAGSDCPEADCPECPECTRGACPPCEPERCATPDGSRREAACADACLCADCVKAPDVPDAPEAPQGAAQGGRWLLGAGPDIGASAYGLTGLAVSPSRKWAVAASWTHVNVDPGAIDSVVTVTGNDCRVKKVELSSFAVTDKVVTVGVRYMFRGR